MTYMRKALTRSNVMIVSTLVLVVSSVLCYKYLSTSSEEPDRRSIHKRPTSRGKESNKELEAVSEATATTTTSIQPIVLTESVQEPQTSADETSKEEPTEEGFEAHTQDEAAATEEEKVKQHQNEAETPKEEQSSDNTEPDEEEFETHTHVTMTPFHEEDYVKQHQSEAESSTSDEPVFGCAYQENELQQDEACALVPPFASSSTTSLCSSSSSNHFSDKTYPNTSPSVILNTTNVTYPKSTGCWKLPSIESMPQTSAQNVKPQYLISESPQRKSFYTAEVDNTTEIQFTNPIRKNKRATRKRMTRQELIEDQRQTHNASFKSRCKFWPNCSNRNCKYKHPVKECRVGEECQFGDRCMFIHPSDIIN